MAIQNTSNTFNFDCYVNGVLSCKQLTPPNGSIADAAIAAGVAGNYVQQSKLGHKYLKQFAQESATIAAVEGRAVHAVKGLTGTIRSFKVGNVVANIGAATVTVDLLVNGASVLSAAIVLANTDTAYGLRAATVNTPAVAVGNILEIKVTAVAAGGGTLAKGVYAEVEIDEDPQ